MNFKCDVIRMFLMRLLFGLEHIYLQRACEAVRALINSQEATCAALARSVEGRRSFAGGLSRVRRLLARVPSSRSVGKQIAHLVFANMKGQRAILITDMSQIADGYVITTAIATSRRVVPLLHTLLPPGADQKASEDEHFATLPQLLPPGVEYIILADRAYGHSRIVRLLHPRFRFVLRSKGQVSIRRPGQQWTNINRVRYSSAQYDDFGVVDYCRVDTVAVRVVRTWDRRYKEPLIMLTNLEAPARTIAMLYACRFKVEGFFRDTKDPRYGFQLGAKFTEDFDILEGMLVLFTCTYILLELMGLHAIKRCWNVDYEGSQRRKLARWRLGRMLAHDERRSGLVEERHLIAQVPLLALKTGHWDWQPRPREVVTEWVIIAEVTKRLLPRVDRLSERPCDAALRMRIRQLLQSTGRTQKDLAKAINRKDTHVSSILCGRKTLAPCLLEPVAVFLGVTANELIQGTDWKRAKLGRRKLTA